MVFGFHARFAQSELHGIPGELLIYGGLCDCVHVRDLILHNSSMGIANCIIGNTLYLYSGLVIALKDSVLTGSLKRSILIKCDFHGGSDKVPWTRLSEPH